MRWVAVIFVASLIFFTGVAYASEGIISPIPDDPFITLPVISKPTVSFGDLLSAVPEVSPTPTLMPPDEPTSSPTPTIVARTARKRSLTITLLGDSMIDTLGPIGGGLAARLNRYYQNSTFTVINHGVGAENIDSGHRRLTNGYSYLGLGRNSVVSEKPDIIIVESFGYNPYPLPDINDALTKHWLKLADIVDTIRRELPETKIVIAATIAPNWDLFGDGAPGLSFSPEGKRIKVEEINKYLVNAIAFAKSQNIPIADAYHKSLDINGNGKVMYINAGDHIHYSDAGRSLFAQTVTDTILSHRLLE